MAETARKEVTSLHESHEESVKTVATLQQQLEDVKVCVSVSASLSVRHSVILLASLSFSQPVSQIASQFVIPCQPITIT